MQVGVRACGRGEGLLLHRDRPRRRRLRQVRQERHRHRRLRRIQHAGRHQGGRGPAPFRDGRASRRSESLIALAYTQYGALIFGAVGPTRQGLHQAEPLHEQHVLSPVRGVLLRGYVRRFATSAGVHAQCVQVSSARSSAGLQRGALRPSGEFAKFSQKYNSAT